MIGYGLSECRKAMHCQAGCGLVSWCLIKTQPDSIGPGKLGLAVTLVEQHV